MHYLAVVVLLACWLPGQAPRIPAKVEAKPAPVESAPPQLAPVLVDNLGAAPQSSWLTVGLPPNVKPAPPVGLLRDSETGTPYDYCAGDRCVRLHLVNVKPGRHKLLWSGEATKLEFQFAPGLDLARAVPHWWYDGQLTPTPDLWIPGSPRPGDSFIEIQEADAAHILFHVRAQHGAARLHHDLWATVWSMQSQIDFVTVSAYGDTRNDKQPQEITAGALYVRTGCEQWADFRTQSGLPVPTMDGDGWLCLTNTPGDRLMRGRRILTRGVWLPSAERKGPPLTALYAGWDADWFGGHVAQLPKNAVQDLDVARDRYLHPGSGNYWNPRPYVQPKWSETTGEQAGFGCNLLGRAVSLGEPWFVDAMRWSCDAYAYRPTANREPSGDPFRAAAHPLAVPFGQAFEQRFSAADLAGWPKDGEAGDVRTLWTGPQASEQQHRDARSLHAEIALTRDPALLSVVADCLELEQRDVMRMQNRVGAGRALGRMLLDFTGGAWLGFDGYRPLIAKMLDATGNQLERNGGAVFVLGEIGEAKYGWANPDGSPVIGWQPWQNTIAATQGLWQAWRITGDPRARDWALRGAREVVDLAFFQSGGGWRHVYAFAWNNGQRPPPAAFDGSLQNQWLVVDSAADYWDLASCELVAQEEPDTDLGRKAREVLKAYGAPRDWMQSQWRSVR